MVFVPCLKGIVNGISSASLGYFKDVALTASQMVTMKFLFLNSLYHTFQVFLWSHNLCEFWSFDEEEKIPAEISLTLLL